MLKPPRQVEGQAQVGAGPTERGVLETGGPFVDDNLERAEDTEAARVWVEAEHTRRRGRETGAADLHRLAAQQLQHHAQVDLTVGKHANLPGSTQSFLKQVRTLDRQPAGLESPADQ